MGKKMIKRPDRMNSMDTSQKIVFGKMKNLYSMEDITRMLQKNQVVDFFRDINQNANDEFEVEKDSIQFMNYKFEAKRH